MNRRVRDIIERSSQDYLEVVDGAPEFNEAFARLRQGDPGPYCILSYQAGMPEPLIGCVLDGLVPAGSDMAYFIAQVLAGEYVQPRDKVRLLHKNRVISLVNIYERALREWLADPRRNKAGAEIAGKRFKSRNGIHRCVAEDLCMTPKAVAAVIARAGQSSDI